MAKNKQTDRTEKILKDTFVQALKKMPIEKYRLKNFVIYGDLTVPHFIGTTKIFTIY